MFGSDTTGPVRSAVVTILSVAANDDGTFETPAEVSRELALLGDFLRLRIDDVVLSLRSPGRLFSLDPRVEAELGASVRRATDAVGRWMAGGEEAAVLACERRVTTILGRIAAERDEQLDEIARRCFRWRDATVAVLETGARSIAVSRASLDRACEMVRGCCDATLIGTAEVFEVQRLKLHGELEQRQDELAHQATHDALTGLPNRTLLLDRISQMLVRSRRLGQPVAVLFVDLDGFKKVNDSYGHRAGDEVLVEVASRLSKALRESDTLGRLGGDEFVVAAELAMSGESAETIATRLIEALREPFLIEDRSAPPIEVSASVGIATGEGERAEQLLRKADIAMYRAKWGGKNRFSRFETLLPDGAEARLELEMQLRQGLVLGHFGLVFQPSFELSDLSVTALEALLRYEPPGGRELQAFELLPVLEDSGLIIDVGRWVLHEACRSAAAWQAAGHRLPVTVNLSAHQFEWSELAGDVTGALETSGLAAESLSLDIPELALLRDLSSTKSRLLELKALGVRLTIDDFGTGYASLAQLRELPVDQLKIDGSCVMRMLEGGEGEAVVRSLLELGRALGIETLAEGIELEPQLTRLRAGHCGSGQGYLLAEPLRSEEVASFLAAHGGGMRVPRRD